MATKVKQQQADSIRTRLEQNQKDMQNWRESVTVILTQQTEILAGLREDFKKHEEQEEKYQNVVTEFMQTTGIDGAIIKEKSGEQEKMIDKVVRNHEDAMKLIREINNKVWLVTGAVIIYCPIIAYMATKLFEHLTIGTVHVP